MANGENVNQASDDNDQLAEELKKSKMRTMIVGAVAVVAVVSLFYMWSSRSKLEAQIQEQQIQIQQKDSLMQVNAEELKKEHDRAEANLKKAADANKATKSTKAAPKKSKAKKH